MCAATVASSDLGATRTALRSLRAKGQRRIHFSTESDQRRRQLLKEMSTLELASTIYLAKHRDEIAARATILDEAVVDLHGSGVTRLVLEARDGQDSATAPPSTARSARIRTHSSTTRTASQQANPCCGCPDAVAGPGGATDVGANV